MRLVFMGTPDFAVGCLEALIKAGHDVVAVYSQPDKPVGRKREILPTPVKQCALAHGIEVRQPTTLRNAGETEALRALAPDAVVVVAYGKLIPADMLKVAPLGFINVHASLLPKYRGAAPIQWAVVNGEKETGVTTMLLNEGMDTGDMLERAVTPIGENETAGELFERLSVLGAELILSTLEKLEKGEIAPEKQDEAQATLAPIISKEMALLDFAQSAESLSNLVRGFNPWPIAYTILEGKRLKVYSARVGSTASAPAGTVTKSERTLCVACGDGMELELLDIQLEGSKRMPASEWLKGRAVEKETVLGAL